MAFIYNDVDISEYITPRSVVHEMYAGGHADTLEMIFDDEENLWPRWDPKVGDTLIYQDGGTSTGKMYLYDFEYSNAEVRLYASNTPPGFMSVYSKTWEEVYLSQILSEVTESYQLNGIDDVWYRYKPCNTKLISFLNTMAELEGAVLVLYNGKTMFVSEQALEAQEAVYQIDTTGTRLTINDHAASVFNACVVRSGKYFGTYKISDGENIYKPNITVPLGSDAEAYRYAKSLLRYANKQKTMVKLKTPLTPELSAGVCIDLSNEATPSWGGKMYCYRVRHDYNSRESTIFMRRPLEGY